LPDPGDPRLLALLTAEIRAHGPIPFARFMDLALHHPEHGYYAAGGSRIGEAGDFITASDLGPAFGRALARQIIEVDRVLGRPAVLDVLEHGAGRGYLARDVLDALALDARELRERIAYTLVDRSRGMREAQERVVPEARVLSPAEAPRRCTGCVLAVELFDALPVHRLRRRDGRLLEVYVDLDRAGKLVESEGEPTPEAEAWAERYGAAAESGSEAEACPAALDLLDAFDRELERGIVFVIDYGEEAPKLYAPARRAGTLLAYFRHTTNVSFLERVGRQDLTAHVNFSALEDRARELGLRVLGRTTQDRFLVANGILEEFVQPTLREVHDPRRVEARQRALELVHPGRMGRRFRVLALGKGLSDAVELSGLVDPFGVRSKGQVLRPDP
jgi:SAM-dependent MidA family methyltransferase